MKRFIFILIHIAVLFTHLYANPDTAGQKGIDFSIRYYDKKIYFPGSDIKIKARITNNSSDVFQFQVADKRVYNLDFQVTTLKNLPVEHSQEFITERISNQPVFVREVILDPDEEYSFIVNLADFVQIGGPGVYVVHAVFSPVASLNPGGTVLRSNNLTLSIRPSLGISEVAAQIDEETGQVLRKEALPPDEVVSYTILGRQKGQWDKFFLYIDLEGLLNSNPDLKARYVKLSQESRERMLSRFKDDLRFNKTDNKIIEIPTEFSIIKTSYTPAEATVKVIEKFKFRDFTEIKEYTYYLHRKDGVWYIYNYTVQNIGTE